MSFISFFLGQNWVPEDSRLQCTLAVGRYIYYSRLDNVLKGTVVNRTSQYVNRGSIQNTSTDPFTGYLKKMSDIVEYCPGFNMITVGGNLHVVHTVEEQGERFKKHKGRHYPVNPKKERDLRNTRDAIIQ